MKDAIKERLKKPQTVVSVAAAVLFIAAFAFSYVKWGGRMLDLVSDTQGFKDWLQSFGVWGRFIFVGIRSLQTVVKIIPAEPLEIGTGFVYGTLGGCLLCFAGTFLGSLVIILLTRLFGKRVISLFVPEEKIRELGFLNDEKKISGLLLCIYLIPGTPKDFITYLTCILPISTTRFMVITMLARIPSIITSTWCGAELGESNYKVSALIFGATLILSLLGVVVYRRVILARAGSEKAKRTVGSRVKYR